MSSWERRLADRTIAVAVAAGELIEVEDPLSGEKYYASSERYETAVGVDAGVCRERPRQLCAPVPPETQGVPPSRPEQPVRRRRHAAPKEPGKVKTHALRLLLAGVLTLPALFFGVGAGGPSRPAASISEPLIPPTNLDDAEETDPARERNASFSVASLPAARYPLPGWAPEPVAPAFSAAQTLVKPQAGKGKHRKARVLPGMRWQERCITAAHLTRPDLDLVP